MRHANEPLPLYPCIKTAMAEGSGKGEEEERDTLKEAEANIASVKKTLAAIDDLDRRWRVSCRAVYQKAG